MIVDRGLTIFNVLICCNKSLVSQKFFAVNDEENINKVSVHVEVPQETVAYLIGRGGNNIKNIEEETCTSISFIDPGGKHYSYKLQ